MNEELLKAIAYQLKRLADEARKANLLKALEIKAWIPGLTNLVDDVTEGK